MKVCPKCGKVVGFNSYFGSYLCTECGWEDDSYREERTMYFAQKRDYFEEKKERIKEALLTPAF